MTVNIKSLPSKIERNPHWRVNFRPTSYETRISEGPKAALDIVGRSAVRLGGWVYPFISDDRQEQIRADKYIASGIDFGGHVEYWRMYYTGQFINLLAVREKMDESWDETLRREAGQFMRIPREVDVADIPGFISIIHLLGQFTEIFEFAARLCGKRLYETSLEITIELRNVEGFALIAQSPKVWYRYYPATVDRVRKSSVFKPDVLLAESGKSALDWAIYFFGQFGWDDPPVEVLEEDQQKFLSGRL
ncbi:MAG: hypothetical protein ACYSTF_03650 [Planctomycetota bacterium]